MGWSKLGLRPGSQADGDAAYDFARGIIGKVSRTFALGIVLLPGDLGKAVLTGYLLCRIADTVEDDGDAPACFDSPQLAESFAQEATDISGSATDLELLRGTKLVFDVLHQLPPESIDIIERWVREMVRGMSDFVGRYPEGIRIQTMVEYRRYCYYVAGTVGHLLTELWRAHGCINEADYQRLLPNCEAFGEGLQTVNILKDVAWDIERENAAYVPEDLLRRSGGSHQTILQPDRVMQNHEALAALTELAREDLRKSLDYFDALPKKAIKVRLFCLLPILFAVATLREIDHSTAMLESGGGVKISRNEVRSLIVAGYVTTFSNSMTRWLVSRTSRDPFGLGVAKS
jgi:farnesyl-diphosphate farnesyltransferase